MRFLRPLLALVIVSGFASPWSAVAQTDQSPCLVFDRQPSETPTAEVTPTLDGGIGGTRSSFEIVYGPPTEESGIFVTYSMEGCGEVFVGYFGDDPITDPIMTDVTMFSPREDEDQDRFEANEDDWTIEEAMEIVAQFLPPDAKLNDPEGDMGPPPPNTLADNIVVTGSSELLLANVPQAAYDYVSNAPVYGGFSFALMRTMNGGVTFIAVQLQIE